MYFCVSQWSMLAIAQCIKAKIESIPNQGLKHGLPFFQASAITVGAFKPAALLGRNCNIYKMKPTGETILRAFSTSLPCYSDDCVHFVFSKLCLDSSN